MVKIPSSATVKCPHCGKSFRVELDKDKFLGNLECKKCKQKIETPLAYCCVVCAFSGKKCPSSLIMEARMKNLEIKYPEKKLIEKPRTTLFLDSQIK